MSQDATRGAQTPRRRAFGQHEPDGGGAGCGNGRDHVERRQNTPADQKRTDAGADDDAHAEGRTDRGKCRGPLAASRAIRHIGLRGRERPRTQQAEDTTGHDHQREGDRERHPAGESGLDDKREQHHRTGKSTQPDQDDGLAPYMVAFSAPERACHDPHSGGQRKNGADLPFLHVQFTRQRRQDRKQERLAHAETGKRDEQKPERPTPLLWRRRRGGRYVIVFDRENCWSPPRSPPYRPRASFAAKTGEIRS